MTLKVYAARIKVNDNEIGAIRDRDMYKVLDRVWDLVSALSEFTLAVPVTITIEVEERASS